MSRVHAFAKIIPGLVREEALKVQSDSHQREKCNKR
jgi:hypothetical protein